MSPLDQVKLTKTDDDALEESFRILDEDDDFDLSEVISSDQCAV